MKHDLHNPPADHESVDLEDLFARYQSSGRPTLLGDLFRHTAAELFSVALQLTKDRSRAEDLVQCTFLEAIRSAPSYSPGRRVLPWLMGILRNLARAERRRLRQAVPIGVNEPCDAVDPLDAACDAELREAVEGCLLGLEEPYRRVLQLHLLEGLASPEIAERVAHSPATVRSQIARGLTLLKDRIPKRVAWGMVIGLVPGRGMTSVEAQVLAQARRSAPGLTARGALVQVAALLAQSPALVAASCLASLAIVFVFSGAMQDQVNASPSYALTDEAPQAVASPLLKPVQVRGLSTSSPNAKAAEAIGQLRIQVDGAQGGLPGVKVRAQRMGDREGRFDERVGLTGLRGLAVLDGLEAGAWQVELDRARGGTVWVKADGPTEWRVDLSKGWDVEVLVVDSTGAPIEGADLWWSDLGHPDAGLVSGRTDARGRVAMEGVAPDFCVGALHAEHSPSQLASLWDSSSEEGLSEREKRPVVHLKLGPRGTTVHGRVLSERGVPIRDALVRLGRAVQPFQVVDSHGGPSTGVYQATAIEARTDENGEYRLAAAEAGERELFVRARGREGERRMISLDAPLGQREDVTLVRGTVFEGRLTEGEEPLGGARVSVAAGGFGAPGWFGARGLTDRRGHFTLRGRLQGAFTLVVDRDSELEVQLPVGAGGGAPRAMAWDISSLRTKVQTPTSPDAWLSVEVQSDDGLPLTGLVVRTRRAGSGEWREWNIDPGALGSRIGPLEAGDYRIIAVAENHVSRVWECVTLERGASVELGAADLARGGRLAIETGRATNSVGSASTERMSVRLFDGGGRLLYSQPVMGADMELPTLPAGTVTASVWGPSRALTLTECQIQQGQTTQLVLEDSSGVVQQIEVVPGSGDAPQAEHAVLVTWFVGDSAVASESMVFAQEEPWRFEQALSPGEYRVRVEVGASVWSASVTAGAESLEPLRFVVESPDERNGLLAAGMEE